MARKCKKRKEEICEDYCFICKDGGLLIICDYKDCLKAYHPECVGTDSTFVESGKRWSCRWHSCFICQKTAKFHCFCCPQAVCGQCVYDAEFVLVKRKKGFCQQCLTLAVLIEKNSNVDLDGAKVDFKDQDTYECLFLDYWKIIKEKEGLPAECVHSADDLLKKGKTFNSDYSLDIGKMEENIDEFEEENHSLVSEYDDSEEIEEYKPVKERSTPKKQPCVKKKEVKSKKKEFIGWGSKTLLEFLAFIGKDTTKQLSQHEVAFIVTDYCLQNQLFHPEKRRKILCDERLQSLLGRKSLLKNSLSNLLRKHFAENFEQSDEDGFWHSSDEMDEKRKRQRNFASVRGTDKTEVRQSSCSDFSFLTNKSSVSSNKKDKTEVMLDVQKSCFASLNAENIKLIYLKRSLVEELLKQPEIFDRKVVGSFVRAKCDPNDYLQRNAHQLLQVKGVKTSSYGQMSGEIILQFSNFPEDLSICKLSDDNFTEEECEDLRNREKDGMLKKLTVVELEQKAKILHEDVTKHWIARQLDFLRKRIDQANEKGWRRELCEYMDKMQLLSDPWEQSRLLKEVPEVIAELDPAVQDFSRDDGSGCNSLPQSPVSQTPNIDLGIECREQNTQYEGSGSEELHEQPHVLAPKAGVYILQKEHHHQQSVPKINKSCCKELFPGFTSEGQINSSLQKQQLSNSSRPVVGECNNQLLYNQQAMMKNTSTFKAKHIELTDEEQDCKVEIRSRAVKDHAADVRETRDKRNQCEESSSKIEIIELSDDEQDCKVEIGSQELENSISSLWYVLSPSGQIWGPESMSLLKLWGETVHKGSKYKVWKEGKKKEEAILLADAIRQNFS